MTDKSQIWRVKLAAWLHDPAEKALILLRDREGHEWGTVKRLRDELGLDYRDMLKVADHYASAADRPQFPLEEGGQRYAKWTQVDFAENPVIKHPLTGADFSLAKLTDISTESIKSSSEQHFRGLIINDDNGKPDIQKTLLNYWRFGPESPNDDLNLLWQNLPADTRVPDHSIWAHLDIVSAFAGAMSADKDNTPALLSISFGPVQRFIAEARSTSDLWAGSHLLARIAWEGMKVVCERLGPDAVLFPNLRGVPLVDVWLRDEIGLPGKAFEGMEWVRQKTDANPLFMAALPNRFVALVPADQAATIAAQIERRVHEFINTLGTDTLVKILGEIDEPTNSDLPCYQQLDKQLQDFPEVYWAAVPWSLVGKGRPPETGTLRKVLSNFYPEGEEVGFLDSHAWQVLQQDIELDGARFYAPNPGVLYPALYDLLDRVAAAAKSARTFSQQKQIGFRSSMNGEREWLTLDRSALTAPPGKRNHTLWTRLSEKRPAWVKKGEHLDALNAIKRFWPTLFTEEVSDIVGKDVRRYVISTHTLALAVSMDRWLDHPTALPLHIKSLLENNPYRLDNTVLPRRIMHKLHQLKSADAKLLCRKLPALLDILKDSDGQQEETMLSSTEQACKDLFGDKPEAYYGMILLDGDHMGAWLAGNEAEYQLTYGASWHPAIKVCVENRFSDNQALQHYLNEKRPTSPARHRSISGALNHFSIHIARFVVEDCFKGKLIYAGGDDVLAFVCVDDLLPAMTLLRSLYSGQKVPAWVSARLSTHSLDRFESKNGYVKLDRQLYLTMGEKAEASAGAVVAHHQTPLAYVLRRLRQAESQAKNEGDRNAFSLHILKRGGGEISVTDKWTVNDETGKTAPALLDKFCRMLSAENVSRRAAYHSLRWLQQLSEKPPADMLQANLVYQFKQQGGKELGNLARELAAYVSQHHPDKPAKVLEDMLMVAEFLAREGRAGLFRNNNAEDAA